MKIKVMIGCAAMMYLAACGEPAEDDATDTSPGFDVSETFDMPTSMSDMSTMRDASPDMRPPVPDMPPPARDMTPDLPPSLDMLLVDMPPVQDMPQDMPPEPEDMAMMPDLDPGTYPPVTSAPLTGNGRPAEIVVPMGFDNSREVPLIIGLHGYGGDKDSIGRYFSLKRNVDGRDFIMVSPEGMTDALGSRFWNATPACCNGFNTQVDDSAYLRGLIEEAIGRFRIDRGRIYVAGYSNGGFMAYRLACDSADYVTGIFSLAGGSFKDAAACQPSQPVQILQLHGTSDQTINYNGGSAYPGAPMHPGAVETVTNWATYNGCDATPMMLDATDVNAVTVEDVSVTGFGNCPVGGQVELWTLPNAPHNPGLPQTMGDYLLDRFFAIDRTP